MDVDGTGQDDEAAGVERGRGGGRRAGREDRTDPPVAHGDVACRASAPGKDGVAAADEEVVVHAHASLRAEGDRASGLAETQAKPASLRS